MFYIALTIKLCIDNQTDQYKMGRMLEKLFINEPIFDTILLFRDLFDQVYTCTLSFNCVAQNVS